MKKVLVSVLKKVSNIVVCENMVSLFSAGIEEMPQVLKNDR